MPDGVLGADQVGTAVGATTGSVACDHIMVLSAGCLSGVPIAPENGAGSSSSTSVARRPTVEVAGGEWFSRLKGTSMGFWDFFGLLIWSFLFVMYLMVLFHIFGDLFRDRELGGGAKALWTVGLIFLPFLLMLIYLVVRGRGMAERQAGAIRQAQTETDRYIKSVAGSSSPADQISSAKALLDSGSITQAEFDQLKAKALA